MSRPQVTETDFTERAGIIKVDTTVWRARCIWRETPLRDVGIDGQIEYVTPGGEATGRLVGVQVKSGSSHFAGGLQYRVPAKHAAYWETFALPVILVLHHPDKDLTVWADARAALRRGENPVQLSLANVFDAGGVIAALETTGPLPAGRQEPDALLAEMVARQHAGMSFLDLFAHGMTDIAYSLYFNMDLVSMLLEHRAWERDAPWGVGHETFEFLDSYVGFLVAHDLVRLDFDAWNQAAIERQMTGSFIAPLTAHGRQLVSRIAVLNRELVEQPGPVIRERSVQLVVPDMGERVAATDAFSQALMRRFA
jgi:hypothetical protein